MTKTAQLTRMVLPTHECPFGLRARTMLEQAGYQIDETILATREQVEAYKAEHQVATTPQVSIDGHNIGGSDDLERFLATAPAD